MYLGSFYNKTFEDQFHMCLEFPAQNRYIIAFPLVCGHFQSCAHELCPEEVIFNTLFTLLHYTEIVETLFMLSDY